MVDEDWLDLKGLPRHAFYLNAPSYAPATLWVMEVLGQSTFHLGAMKDMVHLRRERLLWHDPRYEPNPEVPTSSFSVERHRVAFTPEEVVRDFKLAKRVYIGIENGNLKLLQSRLDWKAAHFDDMPNLGDQARLAVPSPVDSAESIQETILKVQANLDFWRALDPEGFISVSLET